MIHHVITVNNNGVFHYNSVVEFSEKLEFQFGNSEEQPHVCNPILSTLSKNCTRHCYCYTLQLVLVPVNWSVPCNLYIFVVFRSRTNYPLASFKQLTLATTLNANNGGIRLIFPSCTWNAVNSNVTTFLDPNSKY